MFHKNKNTSNILFIDVTSILPERIKAEQTPPFRFSMKRMVLFHGDVYMHIGIYNLTLDLTTFCRSLS